MGSFGAGEDEHRLFDAQESIASVADFGLGCSKFYDSGSGVENWESGGGIEYDVWIKSPKSVRERRGEFLRWMGADLDGPLGEDLLDLYDAKGSSRGQIGRAMENSGTVLRNSYFEDGFSLSRSTVSSWSMDTLEEVRQLGSNENFVCRICNSDGAGECNSNDLLEDGRLSKHRSSVGNHLPIAEEFEDSSGAEHMPQPIAEGGIRVDGHNATILARLKNRWLSRIRSMTCIMDQDGKGDKVGNNVSNPVRGTRVQRVKVRHNRKHLKELSALFRGQDIKAHEGAILTMKFSLDGQYLASAGEDKVVCIWQVVEDQRANETDIPDIDPSCLYFAVDHLSELAPLVADKEKLGKSRIHKRTKDAACIIFPPKVFRISEEPLHIFHGHTADILDLSWSTNNCLLSSSVDKTVHLWKVGCDQCLRVFAHSDYVTCIQFNPLNDDYFISGSIDGKVRIWEISGRRVVDWTDVRDIVTAVSYRPDGQGGIIGSMTGTCHLFSVADNHHLQMEAQICLTTKKKSPCRRITGFQFFPKDHSKVMVTCADSQVRIISGINVIRKYRGPKIAVNQVSANFTSDGKHIISACEDSNVYMWNCFSVDDDTSPSQPKTIRSFEYFSSDASVAIPWFGLKVGNPNNGQQLHSLDQSPADRLPFSSACLSLGQEFFLESIPRGSATWPEEKLPASSSKSVSSSLCKSQYKFLRTSFQRSSSSHAWGLVIVTAGWDGRIRSFHNYGLPIPL